MACLGVKPLRFSPINFSQEEHAATAKKMEPSSFHKQFVDISARSSRSALPLYHAKLSTSELIGGSSLRSRNRSFCSVGMEILHSGLVQRTASDFPLLYRKALGLQSMRLFAVSASSATLSESMEEGLLRLGGFCIDRSNLQIISGAASTIMFAVANKALYKMALVPLKEYPFLALINTFGNCTYKLRGALLGKPVVKRIVARTGALEEASIAESMQEGPNPRRALEAWS